MIILDTNVLSELLRREPEKMVVQWVDAQPVGELVTTAITVQESFYGAELVDQPRRIALVNALERLFDELTVVPYDETCARYTAVVLARARLGGRPMHQADAQIAGIALRHGATLATGNTRDFALTGVTLHDPWSAGDG